MKQNIVVFILGVLLGAGGLAFSAANMQSSMIVNVFIIGVCIVVPIVSLIIYLTMYLKDRSKRIVELLFVSGYSTGMILITIVVAILFANY